MPDLRSNRPRITYGDVWCAVCDKPCDFAEYGEHVGNFRNDGRGLLSGEGWVNILISCHGAEEVQRVRFSTLRAMGYDGGSDRQKIIAFDIGNALQLPSARETKLNSDHEQENDDPTHF